MTNENLVFDAAGSKADGTDPGSPLLIGPGTGYGLLEGTQFPAPPLNVLYAGSIDTEGQTAASRQYGNRTLTVKLQMKDPTGGLLSALQAKFAKLQREGGTLKRTMKNGDVRIYDVVAADGWSPSYDFDFWVADVVTVEMTLPAMPFSRGVEITLSDHVETTLPVLVFTETSLAGDVSGLGRLVADNDNGSARRSFVTWGIQSRYYDSASTSALFFEAESLSATFAPHTVAAVGAAGASGSTTNKVMRQTSISGFRDEAFRSSPFPLTHVGNFVVWARVQAPVTNAGTVSLALEWSPSVDGGDITILNDYVPVVDQSGTPIEGSWVWANLGQITIPTPIIGPTGWYARFTAAGNGSDAIDWDCVAFVPFTEGSGIVHDVGGAGFGSQRSFQIRWDAALVTIDGTTNWRRPSSFEGDYMIVPMAGQEARTTRMIMLLTGAPANPPFDNSIVTSPAIDDVSARLFFTPRYLT